MHFVDHTRLGVWTLDGDPSHVNLLRFSLTEDNFTDTTVVFTVSMTTPWNIMDQLQTWASMLQDHIDKLALSAERTKGLQKDSEYLYYRTIWTRGFVNPAFWLPTATELSHTGWLMWSWKVFC